MKKGLLITLIVILVLGLLAAAGFVFRDPILDALPIDQSGWEENADGRYYLNEDGDPVTGWQEIDGSRYYFDPTSGAMSTGWLDHEGNRYFLSETDGAMVIGWLNRSTVPYYFGENGAMVTGWQEIDGKRYYFSQEGSAQTGWLDIDGQRHHFGPDGTLTTGWLETDKGRYFLTGEGTPYSGWLTDATGTYYLNADGVTATGWLDIDGKRYYLNDSGLLQTGWLQLEGQRFYLNPDGSAASGWQDIDQTRYYFNGDGSLHTGWLEWEGETYYLLEDGTAAKGKHIIDGETHYFTSTGANILLVNRWNLLPDDYEVELVELDSGHKVSTECYEALMQMLADCRAAGHNPYLYSSYRTHEHQQRLFNNMIRQEGSEAAAAKIVAIPGTSEHQLGLAVDITDNNYRKLNHQQEKTETQKWLMENCWNYGFIVRYPNDTTDITGIIYEPWHYRYVGLELAQEMKENGLCLEEYLDQLTGDGSTCGDPNNQ